MDISWSSVLVGICVETHFAFLIEVFLVQFDPLGLLSVIISKFRFVLMQCDSTGKKHKTVIHKYNYTYTCFYSDVATVHVNILPWYSLNRDTKQIHASFFYVELPCSIEESSCMHKAQHPLWINHIASIYLRYVSHLSYSSNQDICSNFLLEDIDIAILQRMNSEHPLLELMCALTLTQTWIPSNTSYFLLEVQLFREFNV